MSSSFAERTAAMNPGAAFEMVRRPTSQTNSVSTNLVIPVSVRYQRGLMRLSLMLLLLVTLAAGVSHAQTPLVVGTWRLVSFESRDKSGEVRYPLGRNATGQISYGADGSMSAILVQPDRPPFVSGDMQRGTDAEVRSAFEGFVAYFGSYSIDAEKGTVTHHVKGSSFPNWTGSDLVRFYKLEGEKLTLSTLPFLYGGESSEAVLVWERVK